MTLHGEVCGLGRSGVLRSAWEEERRILQRIGVKLHLVTVSLELTCQTFTEGCDAATIGPTGS